MKSFFALSLLSLATFLLPAARAADVPITVQIDGQTYIGSVAKQTPTTATGAGLELPAPQSLVGGSAPLSVHLDALDAIDPLALRETRVTWDFGDAGSSRNEIEGYNAAHAYDAPGTYAITRTVETPAGRTVRRFTVTVTPDARRPIHVAADGDDARDGATPATAIRTWGRAAKLLGANTAILLRRGDRFAVDRTMEVRVDGVRFSSYGDPALAAPVLASASAESPLIGVRGARFVIEDVAFDSDRVGSGVDKSNVADAMHVGGRGVLIRNCTFLNVGCAANGNGKPEGVLMIGNDAPLPTGVRAYFAWIEGGGWTVLDNRVANSTREHILRVGGGERVNVQFNRFANLDRRDDRGGDGGDISKTTISIQKGRVAYVARNVLRDGPLSCGPLGGGDGVNDPAARWLGATFEDNRLTNVEVQVQHGAQGITYRNNLVDRSDGVAFAIYDFDAAFGRGCVDVAIEHNAILNAAARGIAVRVGSGATGVRIVRNVFCAPALWAGTYGSGPVAVKDAATTGLALVEGNRWSTPGKSTNDASARGGPFLIGGAYVGWSRWQQIAPSDKLVAMPAGTIALDDAGVDASRLPPP